MDKRRPFKPEAHYILKGTHYLVLTPYVDGSCLVEDVSHWPTVFTTHPRPLEVLERR